MAWNCSYGHVQHTLSSAHDPDLDPLQVLGVRPSRQQLTGGGLDVFKCLLRRMGMLTASVDLLVHYTAVSKLGSRLAQAALSCQERDVGKQAG